MKNKEYALLINTCDKFEDCWDPFFKLFEIYWPDFNGRIYLNTEKKDYSYGNLPIIPLKVSEYNDGKKLTWSECLKRALGNIKEEIILYLQEDYFLKDIVKNEVVEGLVSLVSSDKDIHCIHLTDQAVKASKESKKYEGLNIVNLNQRYRVSCQAALWKKKELLKLIRTYESAWNFEEFGSKRSTILNQNFYAVKYINEEKLELNKYEIIPYIFTGIVQGRWYEEVVPLFEKNEIKVDYSKRGFLKNAPNRTLKMKLLDKLKKVPVIYSNYIDMRRLRMLNGE